MVTAAVPTAPSANCAVTLQVRPEPRLAGNARVSRGRAYGTGTQRTASAAACPFASVVCT